MTRVVCITQANKVLEWIMDPKTGGVHPELFGPLLKGICFINIVEVGFIFSGNVGTGIVLARNETDGSWSPPWGTHLFVGRSTLLHVR